MTTQNPDVLEAYSGAGVALTGAVPGQFYDDADVKVYKVTDEITDPVETLLIANVDYVLSKQSASGSDPDAYTGSISTIASVAAGEKIVVMNRPGNDQLIDFSAIPYDPSSIERADDLSALRDQSGLEVYKRSPRFPLSKMTDQPLIGGGANGKVLRWNARGDIVDGPHIDDLENAEANADRAEAAKAAVEAALSGVTVSYGARNAANAALVAGLTNGAIAMVAGLLYLVDDTATGVASAFYDLGVDGVVPFGGAENGHFGVEPDGSTNWDGGNAALALRARSLIERVTFRAGYYAMGWNMDRVRDSGAKYHMDPGAVFGGVFHLISDASPTMSPISTIARASNVVTVVTTSAHGYSVGDVIQTRYVETWGSGSVSFNGDAFTVASVPNSTTLTYAQVGPDATGTTYADGGSLIANAPIKDVHITGLLTTTDRLGTINCKDCFIERCWVKNDPSQHISGVKARGAHLYIGTENLELRELVIDDADGSNTDAAFAVDGNAWNPSNLRIGRVHVKNSAFHGAFLSGHGHDIGELRIDAFGYGVWPAGRVIQDTNGETQSSLLRSFWANRCWDTNIGTLRTNQDLAMTRGYETHHALIDETGHAYYGKANNGLRIGHWIAKNVRRQGIHIGDATYDSIRSICEIGQLDIELSTEGLGSGQYGLSINGASGDCDVNIGLVRLIDFDSNKGVYSEFQAKGSIGKVQAIGINEQVWDMRGQINVGEIMVEWTGGSEADPIVHLRHPNVAGTRIGLIDFYSAGTITSTVFKSSNASVNWTVGSIKTRGVRNTTGTLVLDGALDFRIEHFDMTGPDSVGNALQFVGSATDGYLGSGRVLGFALGLDKNSATLARLAIVGLNCAGNTAGSNIPVADVDVLGGAAVAV